MKKIGICFDNGKEIVLENIKYENLKEAMLRGYPTLVLLENHNEVHIDTSKISYAEFSKEE